MPVVVASGTSMSARNDGENDGENASNAAPTHETPKNISRDDIKHPSLKHLCK